MTLKELAEFLINNKELVYDKHGMSMYTRGKVLYSRDTEYSLNLLARYYSPYDDGKLHTLGVEGNAMFCLLVHEASK